MQAYLAEKYMSGPKADAILSRTTQKKKKKRKADTATTASSMRNDEEEDFAEAAVAKDRSFKKRRVEEGSGWSTIRAGKEESPPIPADEQPTVFLEEESEQPFTGGLRQEELTKEEEEAAQETIYRDASGRKIDTKAARAEAARKKREREEKEAKKMEWGKGLVQKQEEDARKRQLEKNRSLPFARRADDKELNEELKAKERWNDPAAAFLTKSRSKGPRKPEYTGPSPPPNRFGIKPGYRWDGVDRGNGFEKKYFQRHNERKRNTAASYEWSVDDM
ncbi:Pre-mRNA-splicing factor of RES complex-domain-containing protein [Suillus subalutaceus]|uniref:Pre-mRNA-splicing factor of RES complex-domain-containing protein n=1 Tax=Suillus subalutaceus TaxID=48586 RepID=UPI001B86FAD1|nr:Pre-mRNA-splicing factor of RES complex-domain-containing protein [Suillus subalutaceus]KAG1840703.1 Pre-mRNA-splicing factor of RES complex-domain-containing protein [Suillus subalutaceus]